MTLVNLLHLISGYSSFSSLKVFQRSCSLATLILNEFYFLLCCLFASPGAFMKASVTWIGAGLSSPVLPVIFCRHLLTRSEAMSLYVIVIFGRVMIAP